MSDSWGCKSNLFNNGGGDLLDDGLSNAVLDGRYGDGVASERGAERVAAFFDDGGGWGGMSVTQSWGSVCEAESWGGVCVV